VGLSTAITKDGQTTTTARITFAQGVTSSLTTDSTSTSTGSIITAGGVGIAKALFVGTTASIAGVTNFSAGTVSLPAITTTGDTNTGIFFPAADTIAFTEGGAESMRIDSSGNVGIGTSSPNAKLVVVGRLQVYNSSGADGGFRLSSTSDVSYYDFEVNDSSGLEIQQNNTTRITLNTSGNVKFTNNISVGNATPTTSGTGITFPATQSASSDANTLDDYEEGTWTPIYAGSSSNPTVTYATQQGVYTKIGNLVTVSFFLSASAASGGSGDIRVTGFPFSTVSTDLRQGAGVVNYQNLSGVSTAGAIIYISPSSSTGVLQTLYGDSGVGVSTLTSGTFNKNLSCTFTYRVS
jgi:hypothetical protein